MSTLLSAALATASKGKPVFPCTADKTPLIPNGFKDASTDAAQIKVWWHRWPNALIALPTGKASGVLVIDVDVGHAPGVDGNDAMCEFPPIPDTLETITPRGGRHILFNYPPGPAIRNSVGKLGLGLDVRAEGGYIIIPPSQVNGHRYEWEASNPDKMADAPQWLVDRLRLLERVPAHAPAPSERSVAEGARNAHLTSLAGSMRRRGMSVPAMEAALLEENTQACSPPLEESEVRVIAASVGRYEPAPQPSAPIDGHPGPLTDIQEAPAIEWQALLLYKDDNLTPKPKSHNNACVLIKFHPTLQGVFAFNQFSLDIDVISDPPWDQHAQVPRPLADTDITMATGWLEHQGIFVQPGTAHAAIVAAAKYRQYDPLRDYLLGLVWDGHTRLDTWLIRLFGVPDSPYARMVGRKYLIGAVARGLRPGCKMDTMVVLEGPQGWKKSSGLEALFSEKWFTDEVHSIGSKDAAMQLQGRWGIEIPEMHAMSKAETNQIKEWITRKSDKFRPPYAKCVIESPRRCVMAGTLNPDGGYLKDSTGGRRFWPVECGTVDVDGIEKERDQLFAEAVVTFNNNEQWWIELKEDIALAKEEQDDRYESDPWAEAIDEYVSLKASVSTASIMEHALELNMRDWTKLAEMRIGKHLTTKGWVRRRRMVNGERAYLYERDTEIPDDDKKGGAGRAGRAETTKPTW